MVKIGLAFIVATLTFAGLFFLSIVLDWPRPVQQLALALFAMGIPLSAGAGALIGAAYPWPWRRSSAGGRAQAPQR